jgi:hypothetical protein
MLQRLVGRRAVVQGQPRFGAHSWHDLGDITTLLRRDASYR